MSPYVCTKEEYRPLGRPVIVIVTVTSVAPMSARTRKKENKEREARKEDEKPVREGDCIALRCLYVPPLRSSHFPTLFALSLTFCEQPCSVDVGVFEVPSHMGKRDLHLLRGGMQWTRQCGREARQAKEPHCTDPQGERKGAHRLAEVMECEQ